MSLRWRGTILPYFGKQDSVISVTLKGLDLGSRRWQQGTDSQNGNVSIEPGGYLDRAVAFHDLRLMHKSVSESCRSVHLLPRAVLYYAR